MRQRIKTAAQKALDQEVIDALPPIDINDVDGKDFEMLNIALRRVLAKYPNLRSSFYNKIRFNLDRVQAHKVDGFKKRLAVNKKRFETWALHEVEYLTVVRPRFGRVAKKKRRA